MVRQRSKPIIYTIGHSTRTIDQFLALLQAHRVDNLVDVRTIPKSRHNPQFSQADLAKALSNFGMRYEHLPLLGGLRHARKDSINIGWDNLSFRGFADYMQTEEFDRGLERLKAIAQERTTAIMCAEAVPWRCHRSLIADALTKQKWQVRHIQSKKTARIHTITPFLRKRSGKLVYPKVDEASRSRVPRTPRRS